jgi:hypothetical protein
MPTSRFPNLTTSARSIIALRNGHETPPSMVYKTSCKFYALPRHPLWSRQERSNLPRWRGREMCGPVDGPSVPFLGTCSPLLGPSGPLLGPGVPFFGTVVPFFGPGVPFFGPGTPFFGPNGPLFGTNGPCLGQNGPFFGSSGPLRSHDTLVVDVDGKPLGRPSRFSKTPHPPALQECGASVWCLPKSRAHARFAIRYSCRTAAWRGSDGCSAPHSQSARHRG